MNRPFTRLASLLLTHQSEGPNARGPENQVSEWSEARSPGEMPVEPTEEFVMESKTFYPSKEFENQLGDLSKLVQDKDWEFPGGAIAQLTADAEAQRRP
jgi:hypothetical protein